MKPIPHEGGFLNLEVTRSQAIEKLAARNPEAVSRDADVVYLEQDSSFTVRFIDQSYKVYYPGGEITGPGGKAPVYQSILILHYLITADGSPLSGEWISFRHLPGGDIYTEPFRRRAVLPFLKAFGSEPESFVRAASALGGSRLEGSGTRIIIPVFPRVLLNFTLWAGDEELPPSAAILFDARAASYLPTEDYAHLPALLIEAMQRHRD